MLNVRVLLENLHGMPRLCTEFHEIKRSRPKRGVRDILTGDRSYLRPRACTAPGDGWR
jgi:hypothetical protein